MGVRLQESVLRLCGIDKREMMDVDMHVRAMFQTNVNDAHVGV